MSRSVPIRAERLFRIPCKYKDLGGMQKLGAVIGRQDLILSDAAARLSGRSGRDPAIQWGIDLIDPVLLCRDFCWPTQKFAHRLLLGDHRAHAHQSLFVRRHPHGPLGGGRLSGHAAFINGLHLHAARRQPWGRSRVGRIHGIDIIQNLPASA